MPSRRWVFQPFRLLWFKVLLSRSSHRVPLLCRIVSAIHLANQTIPHCITKSSQLRLPFYRIASHFPSLRHFLLSRFDEFDINELSVLLQYNHFLRCRVTPRVQVVEVRATGHPFPGITPSIPVCCFLLGEV